MLKLDLRPLFQFHKGTIRTITTTLRCSFCQIYFNSIKVRLEHVKNVVNISVTKFQFHKGTIRTFYNMRAVFDNSYFNSIKVRLEQSLTLINL